MPKAIQVIGLGGFKESGKNTVADLLAEMRPGRSRVLNMSDDLCQMALVLNPRIEMGYSGEGWPMGYAHLQGIVAGVGWTKAKEHPEVRRFLQVLGTDVARNMIDPEFWVTRMMRKINAALDEGFIPIVTGIRFENERKMIASYGGIGLTVWVDRESVRPAETGETLHASERSVAPDDFQVQLANNGTLYDLRATIRPFAEHELHWRIP